MLDKIKDVLQPFRPSAKQASPHALSHVDVCFVVDTTGSMSPFLGAARRALLDTVAALVAKSAVNLRLGLVEYRDHPPQERTFVTRHYALTDDLKKMQKVIDQLRADGGGDHPEAVYDGVHEASILTEWRAHSCRYILLVGDAPPHGYRHAAAEGAPEVVAATPVRGRRAHRARAMAAAVTTTAAAGDGRQNPRCACGLDAANATAAAEDQRVTVHALPMSQEQTTIGAFTEIARATGGECAPAADAGTAISRLGEMLDREFHNLSFDRTVLEQAANLATLDAGEIGERLGCSRLRTASALARLGRRGFLAA